jgi:hypothetical protein
MFGGRFFGAGLLAPPTSVQMPTTWHNHHCHDDDVSQALMDRLYRELKRLVASLPHVKIVAALAEVRPVVA